jgi:hypothetical protein
MSANLVHVRSKKSNVILSEAKDLAATSSFALLRMTTLLN